MDIIVQTMYDEIKRLENTILEQQNLQDNYDIKLKSLRLLGNKRSEEYRKLFNERRKTYYRINKSYERINKIRNDIKQYKNM